MTYTMLKGKIHRAVVKQADLNYVGSITVDTELLEAAGEPGSGMICLNGAAARQVAVGDHVILMCYAQMTPEEARQHKPKVVFVDGENHISKMTNYEKHGKIAEDM